jgi:type I restriction enzyme M protein
MSPKKNGYSTKRANGNGTANLGFEAKLWLAADKLRGNMGSLVDRTHRELSGG